MNHIEDIKKAFKTEKAVIGTKEVVKNLRLGKLNKVYLTSNALKDMKDSIKKYASLGKTEVVQLRYANDELGTLCKKPFGISVLGFVK